MTNDTISRPCRMHDHWRLNELLRSLAPHQSLCEYTVPMPNLRHPVLTNSDKNEYQAEIMRELPPKDAPGLLMTCQLTPTTPLSQIEQSREHGVFAWKGYSKGVTTNSDYGIEDWHCPEMHQRAELAGQVGVPFLLHLQDKTPDPLDGELSALGRAMPLIERHKGTMWCIEHPSRGETIAYVEQMQLAGYQIVCTPTLHHATKCCDDVQGNVHLKVQPPLQQAPHRDAVLEAILSGKHIAGWDAAAHPRNFKELPFDQAPSGIWMPDRVAIPFAYQLFKELGGQQWHYNFTKYMGGNAHAFYGNRMPIRNLPPLEVAEEDWEVNIKTFPVEIVPFMAGEILHHRLVG